MGIQLFFTHSSIANNFSTHSPYLVIDIQTERLNGERETAVQKVRGAVNAPIKLVNINHQEEPWKITKKRIDNKFFKRNVPTSLEVYCKDLKSIATSVQERKKKKRTELLLFFRPEQISIGKKIFLSDGMKRFMNDLPE